MIGLLFFSHLTAYGYELVASADILEGTPDRRRAGSTLLGY